MLRAALEFVGKLAKRDARLYSRLLYATMVILFSAVTAKEIESNRRELQLHLKDRQRLNVLRDEAARLRRELSVDTVRNIKGDPALGPRATT